MPRAWVMWGVLIVGVTACGCQQSPPAGKTDGDADSAAKSTPAEGAPGGASQVANPAKPSLPVLEGVDTFEGTWVLAPSIQRASRHLWLLRLSPDDNQKWTIQDLANEPLIGKISGQEVKVTDNQIKLVGQIDNPKAQVKIAKIDFEGRLHDGQVTGNVIIGDAPQPLPARLLPTDAETLVDYADSLPEQGVAQFDKAIQAPDPAHGLWNVAKAYPQSPLALDVYNSLFSQIQKWNFTEEEIRAAAQDFTAVMEPWGGRLQGLLEIEAGLNLAKVRKFIDLSDEFLNAGEARVDQESPGVALKLKAGRINLRIARGLLAINGDNAEAAETASADLRSLLVEQPYHPEILLALAEHALRTKQNDTAIDLYLQIVALPTMEKIALQSRLGAPADDLIPHTALQRLWKEKHGSADGLDAALGETYDRVMGEILERIRTSAPEPPAEDAGNRVLLVEFFTGSACEPCAAPDLAFEGVLQGLPLTEVIQLTYHQHLPLPDPLTSSDGEGRKEFYKLEGTPSVFMNGAPINNVGGYGLPSHIEQNYHILRAPVDFFRKQSTDVTIEPKAEVVDGKLSVKVSVKGVPDDVISKVRLRTAVVEDLVQFVAPNGIRRHHMVVRTMLGGIGGKAANKDKVLEYSLPAMPVAELKSRQLSYLAHFEHGRRVQFDVKPTEMKPLHLVAFVQNDTTKEVLQAAATPIQGELVYPDIQIPTPGELATGASEAETKDAGDKPQDSPPPEEASPEKK